MIPARITVATLGAHDMAAMRAFYRSLGWREKDGSSDGFASFLLEGAILALFPFEHLAADGHVEAPARTTGFRGTTLAINVESREEVDAVIAELRAAGATITKEPEDALWGGRSSYFADPEGNLWEVVWAPHTSFDEHGRFVW
jgi:catechol 2,3-dioxygenase-like lactoylglutathione lyase family enzyme